MRLFSSFRPDAPRKRFRGSQALSVLAALGLATAAAEAAGGPGLVFSCRPDNDLYRVFCQQAGEPPLRKSTPAEAIAEAPKGAGVLLLANEYPARATALDAALFQAAAAKNLRLYVEFPAFLPDLQLGPIRHAQWERTVVASEAFGPALEKMRILMIQDCHFVSVAVPTAHLLLARVAGFDSAVFGLPKKDVWPILFEHPRGDVLVATTKLSQFVTARYGPTEAWPKVWQYILTWLGRSPKALPVQWTPAVRPSYSRLEPLPPQAALEAVRRGADWYEKARLFVHPAWGRKLEQMSQTIERVEPGPTLRMPRGDGSLGLLEAFSSAITSEGAQPVRWYVRADCNSEAAFALALRGRIDAQAHCLTLASNLLDFVDFDSRIQQGPRADPQSPSFGLMGWDTRPIGATVYYGDDNARAVLGQLGAAAALQQDRWDESLLRCILANFRTTGPSGFRNARIEEPELQSRGWRWFWEQSDGGWGGYRECPHYQVYQWAVNLWLYDKTKFPPLLERTKRAIRHLMRVYSQGWQAESAREEGERCRMLLPLAWLVRVEDNPEHRLWLKRVAQYVLGVQDRSGAIQQRVTHTAGRNEDYGTGECALIHANDDPATDLLYAGNFALLGLQEAAAATGDEQLKAAAERLADFLVRCQVRSSQPPELDGVWFRGFDFRRWDYWGSNGDIGWGVWATEAGWTQGWIISALALRHLKTSLWEFTAGSRMARLMDRLRPIMLSDDALESQRIKADHAAIRCGLELAGRPDSQYSADGPETLCNGEWANEHDLHDGWLGWLGRDMVATLDLGALLPIHQLGARFLQSVPVGIFLPPSVEFALSKDGVTYDTIATVKPGLSPREPGPLARLLETKTAGTEARFVRIKAKNLGSIPAWQGRSPGARAWLFCDEIVVNPKP